jgi:hypothetical protein
MSVSPDVAGENRASMTGSKVGAITSPHAPNN